MREHCLVFDCMETLVDMREIPEPADYARWAYEGSGVELLWDGFDAFWESYKLCKQEHLIQHGPFREQDMLDRLTELVRSALTSTRVKTQDLRGLTVDQGIAMLFENFWDNYLSRCYVKEEVYRTLEFFKQHHFRMGVVSNFTVRGGVEEILERCGIASYFEFVHTSVGHCYRKPHPNIFFEVLRSCGCSAHQVIYLGDDYECDFVGAGRFGFNTYLLDRGNQYSDVDQRVNSFQEFADTIKQKCL